MAERSEVAETVCEVLYSGSVSASLASVVGDQAKWILVSGTWQPQDGSDSTQSAKSFQGFVGLRALANFCRDTLQIASGVMTGCVVRGNCLFLFGTICLQAAGTKKPAETNFAGKLIWQRTQIVSGEFRIMWPFPPDTDPE